MKVKDLYEELEEKEFFQEYKKKNPESFLYAGFFVLDLEHESEKIELDIYDPKENKIEIIEFPFKEIKVQQSMIPEMEEKLINPKDMIPLDLDIKVDIDDLKEFVKKSIKENDKFMIPAKIIAVLKDNEWNLTCMDDMFGVLTIKINAKTGKETAFKKSSLMDIVNVKK